MSAWESVGWRLFCVVLNHAGLNWIVDAICVALGWDH